MRNRIILLIGFASPKKTLDERNAFWISKMLERLDFFLQQAVEKFLKAFLLSKGWELERIHDLEVLLNEALAYDPSLRAIPFSVPEDHGFLFGGTLSLYRGGWLNGGRCA